MNVFRCLENDKEDRKMSYVRAALIGVALALFLVASVALSGCKKSHHTTNIQEPDPILPTMECVVEGIDSAQPTAVGCIVIPPAPVPDPKSEPFSVVVTIQTAGIEGLFLAEAEETERQPIEADKAIVLNLDAGQHTLQLIGPGNLLFAECIVEIPIIDDDKDDGDEGDGFEIPPRPERCGVRFDVCHKGKHLRLPWAALEAHSKHAGDSLGACEQQ